MKCPETKNPPPGATGSGSQADNPKHQTVPNVVAAEAATDNPPLLYCRTAIERRRSALRLLASRLLDRRTRS